MGNILKLEEICKNELVKNLQSQSLEVSTKKKCLQAVISDKKKGLISNDFAGCPYFLMFNPTF